MKFAFMSFSTPQLTLAEMLSLSVELGYGGIEPRMGSQHRHGIELTCSTQERKAIRQIVDETNVTLCCLATGCRYADPETVSSQVEETKRSIDLAGDLAVPFIRVFGGQIPQGVERSAAIDQVSAALTAVAEHAAEREVTVCLETHDDWCDPNHVAAVMAAVDAPSIAVNWDILHPIRGGNSTMDAAFTILRPWIRHVHIHDATTNPATLEFLPIGDGEIDHQRAMELLQEDNYSGFLSGEWIQWEPYEIHLARELNRLQAIESNLLR